MHIHLQYISCLYSYIRVNVTERKFRRSKGGCGFSFFFSYLEQKAASPFVMLFAFCGKYHAQF